jgi:hypothetical protein
MLHFVQPIIAIGISLSRASPIVLAFSGAHFTSAARFCADFDAFCASDGSRLPQRLAPIQIYLEHLM